MDSEAAGTSQGLRVVSFSSLTPAQLKDVAAQCAAIDATRYTEMGLWYSDELWASSHFEADRLGKYQLSQVVLCAHETVQGFWVASMKTRQVHHTHRVATRQGAGSRYRISLAGWMGERSLAAGRAAGCLVAQLAVHERNQRALAFYRGMGYGVLRGDALHRWSEENGYAQARLLDDRMVLTDAYRLLILQLPLHPTASHRQEGGR